jgi:hypothetical protein
MRPVVLLVVGAGVLSSGCAIGFRVPATDVGTNSVTLNGYVGSNRSEQGEWWFRYGTTTSLGSETPKRTIQFTELTRHDVTEPLAGLTPSTDYHYVLCADDQEPGVGEFCSALQSFRTFADATSDSLVVSGNAAGGFDNIDIDVSSGPSGENPTGHVAADTPVGHLQSSSISCLSVVGRRATVSGPLDPNPSGYPAFSVTVTDNGPPGPDADTFNAQPLQSPSCSSSGGTGGNLFSGDAVVTDAPAAQPALR